MNKYVSLFFGLVGSVTFLPQEFSGTNERCGMLEFPADDITPLIEEEGKVTMAVDPFCESRIHNSFRSGANSNGFREVALARSGDPGNFG